MAQYRLLSKEELQSFEKEFIEYLILNGIDASAWAKMKNEAPQKAEAVVDLFSDVVFEKVLRITSYVIKILENKIFAFYYGTDEAELIVLDYIGSSDLKLEGTEILIERIKLNPGEFELTYQIKTYQQERELELFQLMESGCELSDGELFNALKAYQLERSN